jgi:hypothetical protein
MPGTGTKQQKKAPAPVSATAKAATAPVVITIANGEPDQDPVTVDSGTRITFINDDNVSYAIEMTSNGNATPPLEIVLPALASVTVVAASTNGKKTVDYTLTVIQQAQSNLTVRNDTGGGGGRIIINS